MDRQTVTVVEAARILGIGRNLAYQAAHSGELPTIKIGGRMVVPRAVLERLIQAPLPPADGQSGRE